MNFQNIDKPLFWEADFEKLDLEKDFYFIINRILTKGDKKDRTWMFENFTLDQIKMVLENTRELKESFKKIFLEVIDEKWSRQ